MSNRKESYNLYGKVGLALVFEGVVNMDCISEGYLFEVTHINNLDTYYDYADANQLWVSYISYSHGLISSDMMLSASGYRLRDLNTKQLILWSYTVAEQIRRVCESLGLYEIHILNGDKTSMTYLKKQLGKYGLIVIVPGKRDMDGITKNTKDTRK